MPRVRIHFWRGTGIVGSLIRFFSWGEVAHVGMQIDSFLFEAREFRGVVASPYPPSPKENRKPPCKTLILECSEEQKQQMLNWWHDRIGSPYDYLSVVRFVTRRKETEETKRKYFCSEAVSDACAFAELPLFERVDSSKIPPSWVYRSPKLKESV